MVVMILQNQSIMYYAKYILMDESRATLILTIYTMTQLLAALFMDKMLNWLGNRNCMLFGFGVFLVLTVVMFAFRKNLILFCIFMLLAGLGKSMATSPCYAICASAGGDDILYDVHDESWDCHCRSGIFSGAPCRTLCGRDGAAKSGGNLCHLHESVLATDADRGRMHGAGIFL